MDKNENETYNSITQKGINILIVSRLLTYLFCLKCNLWFMSMEPVDNYVAF
jgi:hypothetical protein